MTKLGILQLPYNPAALRQLLRQLAKFSGQVVFIDLQSRIDACMLQSLPANVRFVACPAYEIEMLTEMARGLRLDNLVSFAELGLIPAAQVREALGMHGHDVPTELKSVDKHRMRVCLRDAGLSQVRSATCPAPALGEALEAFGVPAIAKPANLTGSIGVQLLADMADVPDYLQRLQANPYSRECQLVLESFIPGAEYSVEGLLLDGVIHLYGVTEKQTTGAPYFVETGHRFDANHPLLAALHPALQAFFRALGMSLCPFHIEFKVVEQRVEIIEIHSRFGGDFITQLLEYSLGNEAFLEYVEYLLHGRIPRLDRQAATITAVGFVPVPAGVVCSVSALPPADAIELLECSVDVRPGDVVAPQTGFYDRPAYFISRLKDRQTAQAFEQWMKAFTIELAIKESA